MSGPLWRNVMVWFALLVAIKGELFLIFDGDTAKAMLAMLQAIFALLFVLLWWLTDIVEALRNGAREWIEDVKVHRDRAGVLGRVFSTSTSSKTEPGR